MGVTVGGTGARSQVPPSKVSRSPSRPRETPGTPPAPHPQGSQPLGHVCGAGAGRAGCREEEAAATSGTGLGLEARPPARQPCCCLSPAEAEAQAAERAEDAPRGAPGTPSEAMRVHDRYSTLPAEDRSVHIVNICALDEDGRRGSEGTVSGVLGCGGTPAHLGGDPGQGLDKLDWDPSHPPTTLGLHLASSVGWR